jgi:hypothetical protein
VVIAQSSLLLAENFKDTANVIYGTNRRAMFSFS